MRQQFGRPIATFQAVKHHCANMLVATELATAAVWDAARAAEAGGDQLSLHGGHGRHARRPGRRPRRPAQHPGPRRHRLHVGARRPPLPAPGHCHRGRHRRRGGRQGRDRPGSPGGRAGRARIDLPPEAEPIRDEVRAFVASVQRSRRRRPARGPDRVGLRHAPLAEALGPRRRRGRAARHRAGVRRGRRQAARTTGSRAGSS